MSANIEDIYQALLDSGVDEDTIDKEINEKYNEFQGFMSKQAILYLIAKEHGLNIDSSSDDESIQYEIDYNDFAIPISNITETMSNIVIIGRVIRNFGIRNFVRKDNSPGKVGSFIIGHSSGVIKIVLWDEHAKIMENDFFKVGEIVQVIGGYSKMGVSDEIEVHLSKKSKLILAPKDVELSNIPELDTFKDMELESSKSVKNDSSMLIEELYNREGFVKSIIGTIQIKDFKEIIKKNGDKTFLLRLILSDKSSSIQVIIWGMKAIESLKILNDGDFIKLYNMLIKDNSYTKEKELVFTKNSRLEIL
jgi:replication factor A1